MKQLSNITIVSSFILAFLGFLDATYLTILHYKNVIPPCSLAHGCETVLTSSYATLGPIPIALIGSLYYLTVIVLLGLLWHSNNKTIKQLLLVLCSTGLLVSVLLVGIQAFVIHAYCQYCLGSEGINLLLFGIMWFLR